MSRVDQMISHEMHFPPGTRTVYATRDLSVGDLVIHDHRFRRVESLTRDPELTQRERLPWLVVLADPSSVNRRERSLSCADHKTWCVVVEPEHHPVCGACGGPWPCRELHIRLEIDHSEARARRFELPGVCPACQEPVTPRQLRQTWPVNLHALARDQPVVFHLRRECAEEAQTYDLAVMREGYPSQLGNRLEDHR